MYDEFDDLDDVSGDDAVEQPEADEQDDREQLQERLERAEKAQREADAELAVARRREQLRSQGVDPDGRDGAAFLRAYRETVAAQGAPTEPAKAESAADAILSVPLYVQDNAGNTILNPHYQAEVIRLAQQDGAAVVQGGGLL